METVSSFIGNISTDSQQLLVASALAAGLIGAVGMKFFRSKPAKSTKKVVIVGGGFAGVHIAKELQDEFDVTLVDPKDYMDLLIASLRCSVEPSFAKQTCVPYSAILKNAKHVLGRCMRVNDGSITVQVDNNGENNTLELAYDYLILCTGSSYDAPIKTQCATSAERLSEFESAKQKIENANHVAVLGGGPVGVELAAELGTEFPGKRVTLIHDASSLMQLLSPKAQAHSLAFLKKKGVNVVLNKRVANVAECSAASTQNPVDVVLNDGERISGIDLTFTCFGSRPCSAFLQDGRLAGCLDERNFLRVDSSLLVSGTRNIFAAGDLANLQETKMAAWTKNHAAVVVANVRKLAKEPETKKLNVYKAPKPMMALSLGRTDGILFTPIGTFTGLIPRKLKSENLLVPMLKGQLGVKE